MWYCTCVFSLFHLVALIMHCFEFVVLCSMCTMVIRRQEKQQWSTMSSIHTNISQLIFLRQRYMQLEIQFPAWYMHKNGGIMGNGILNPLFLIWSMDINGSMHIYIRHQFIIHLYCKVPIFEIKSNFYRNYLLMEKRNIKDVWSTTSDIFFYLFEAGQYLIEADIYLKSLKWYFAFCFTFSVPKKDFGTWYRLEIGMT
jgi:hypothetical protein